MRKRFTEDQIVKILHEAAVGGKVAEVCRKHGVSGFLIKPPKKADLLRGLARARRINRQGIEPRLAKPDEVEELRDLLAEKGLV